MNCACLYCKRVFVHDTHGNVSLVFGVYHNKYFEVLHTPHKTFGTTRNLYTSTSTARSLHEELLCIMDTSDMTYTWYRFTITVCSIVC